jgi:hypothetical protein
MTRPQRLGASSPPCGAAQAHPRAPGARLGSFLGGQTTVGETSRRWTAVVRVLVVFVAAILVRVRGRRRMTAVRTIPQYRSSFLSVSVSLKRKGRIGQGVRGKQRGCKKAEGGKATARDPRMVRTFFSFGGGVRGGSVSSAAPPCLVAFVLVLELSSRSRPSLHQALSICSLSRSLRTLPAMKLPTALAKPLPASLAGRSCPSRTSIRSTTPSRRRRSKKSLRRSVTSEASCFQGRTLAHLFESGGCSMKILSPTGRSLSVLSSRMSSRAV